MLHKLPAWAQEHCMKLIPPVSTLASTLATSAALAGLLCAAAPAFAQVAGSTTTVTSESTQIAAGWSAKKSILDKQVYNETGAAIGKIEDLIISPDKNLSYVIVGAGGFIGIGRHDVAIAISQIKQVNGKFVLVGATKASLQALPEFAYGSDTVMRDQFIASADADIARAELKLTELQAAAANANDATRARLEEQLVKLRVDVKSAKAHLEELRRATVKHWHTFEASVNEALEKVRKSMAA
jgi:sporulation protein YlmC with PRC-barrel domain